MRRQGQKERYIQDAFNLVLIFLLVAYVVFEHEAREYLFFLLTYSEDSLVSRTQPISLTRVTLLCPSLATTPLEYYGNTYLALRARTQVRSYSVGTELLRVQRPCHLSVQQ